MVTKAFAVNNSLIEQVLGERSEPHTNEYN